MEDWYVNLEGKLHSNVGDLSRIVPELILALTFVVALVWDFMQKKGADKSVIALTCILGIVGSMVALLAQGVAMPDAGMAFHNLLQLDSFATFFKIFIGLATVVALIMAMDSNDIQRVGSGQGEYYYLLLTACFGGYLLASASNLLLIYLALETLSLTSYALAGYLPGNRKSAEAGMKYVIYGAMASGIMIFGMSYLFGLTGSMDIAAIAKSLQSTVAGWDAELTAGSLTNADYTNRVAALAIVFLMVFAGFAYKIAAAPFHFWSPDVYEGAPTVSTGFFSVGPKAAGFAVLVRVLVVFFVDADTRIFVDYSTVRILCGLAALATMFIGNLTALAQTNAKRMLAYSSIAHAGYMLAVLTAPENGGLGQLLFYLLAYLFMNFGAFIVVLALEQKRGSSEISALAGAIKTDPGLTVAMCVFLFSLVGMPPLSGFVGKLFIFRQLADPAAQGGTPWHWLLIALIGINSVISLFYYIKIAKVMITEPAPAAPAEGWETTPSNLRLLTYGFGCITLVLGIYFYQVMDSMIRIGSQFVP